MNDKLKKMIAREGLVLIGIVVFGLFVIAINTLCNAIFVKNYVYSPEEKSLGLQIISYAHHDTINTVGLSFQYSAIQPTSS